MVEKLSGCTALVMLLKRRSLAFGEGMALEQADLTTGTALLNMEAPGTGLLSTLVGGLLALAISGSRLPFSVSR